MMYHQVVLALLGYNCNYDMLGLYVCTRIYSLHIDHAFYKECKYVEI